MYKSPPYTNLLEWEEMMMLPESSLLSSLMRKRKTRKRKERKPLTS